MKEIKKPNILWICTDQQRFDTLGCMGNTFVHTPELDKLAANGAMFENAITQSPVCTPSRGCFLTGRYPITCGTRQNGASIPDTEILVTRLLHEAGYTCGLSGKLHLSACNPNSGCTEIERRINDGYDEFHWSHDTASVWGLNNEYYKWLKEEHNITYSTPASPESKYVNEGMPIEKHQTYWCAQKAIEFIEAPNRKDNPWEFSVNIYDPHHPFDPPKELLDRYRENLDSLPLPSYWENEEKTKTIWQVQDHQGAYNQNAGFPYAEMSDTDHRMVKAAYWAMCDMIDLQVGRMIKSLKDSNQLENTIVVFHSDHGEMLGDHGIYLKGPFFYDCSIKVPLIISWQGHIKPGKYSELIPLIDLPATLLDICSIPKNKGMQGRSFNNLLEGKDYEKHLEVYCEYLNAMPWHKKPYAFASMVRNEKYKIVVAHSEDGVGELYDLISDPEEKKNLYDLSDYKEIKIEMMEKLLKMWSKTCDPLPLRKGDW